MDTVEALWRQIETWLSIHALHAWHMLRPGASQWEIQEAEVALGITLPEHFKASYRIHDGGYIIDLVTEIDAGIPYYFTEHVTPSGWQTGPIQPVWWHQRWIPFGRDRAGNHCCLDLIPAPGGSVGQIIDRDHEAGPSRVLAASFLEVLSTFASDLEAGTYVDTDIGLRG